MVHGTPLAVRTAMSFGAVWGRDRSMRGRWYVYIIPLRTCYVSMRWNIATLVMTAYMVNITAGGTACTEPPVIQP